jgi:hypothetical protein
MENHVENSPVIKYLIVGLLILIVGALATAFKAMVRGPRNSTAGVKALTVRVGLSIALFVLLMVLSALGIIEPHTMR